MKLFPSYPVGARVPDSPHAVCCSLPTLRDVIGYEENDPTVRRHVIIGYPRFVEHTFVRQLTEHVRRELGWRDFAVALAPSVNAAEGLRRFLSPVETIHRPWGPLQAVRMPDHAETALRTKRFFQHTGCGISSRQAEDCLFQSGLIDSVHSESAPPVDPRETVLNGLHESCPEADPEYLLLCRSGMNAFYSAFHAARELQRPREKKLWIQLGWLYLDTIRILETFLGPDEDHIALADASNLSELEDIFAREGDRIAGVITETPTNPLLQTANLPRLRQLCDRTGALLFVDPTLASFHNVNVLPWADVVLHSLTKYYGHRGDVMMGLAAFNPRHKPFAREWLRLARECHEPPYRRDLEQLAAQIGDSAAIMEKINRNTLAVAEFLEKHPRIKRLHWTGSDRNAADYRALSRDPDRPGGILTLDLAMPLADFYDAAPFVKGPSFGTGFTMMCPFMYLAHYDLASTPEGRRHLESRGINPDLIRLSIGAEPVEEIIQGLGQALG